MLEIPLRGVNLFDEKREDIVDLSLFVWQIDFNDSISGNINTLAPRQTEDEEDYDYLDYRDYFHKVTHFNWIHFKQVQAASKRQSILNVQNNESLKMTIVKKFFLERT